MKSNHRFSGSSGSRASLGPLALALLLGACSDGLTGNAHPTDRVNFPLSVTADPSGHILWVVSGNFDFAYRGGAVLGYDVVENRFIHELGFELGGFPGPFSLLERDGQAIAGFIASRAENNLYSVTLSGDPTRPTVACPDGVRGDDPAAQILRCPKSGTITERTVVDGSTRVDLGIGEDPFGVAIRKSRNGDEPDLLLVGGMRTGRVAQLALDQTGTPELIGQFELGNGLFGLIENPTTGRVYTSSKLSSALSVLEVTRRERTDKPGELDLTNPWLRLVSTVTIPEPAVVRDRARGLAISKDGTRLYAAYRTPNSFIIIDIADDGRGNAKNRVLQKIALANGPTSIAVHEVDGRELVYVSCYRDNRVEVIDPIAGQIIASIKTGAGPSGLAIIDRPDLGVRRLYVALFTAQAIGVIDLDPSSPFYHTEIAEIR